MTWTTLRLRVVTPLFSGDHPKAETTDSPIRVPSIRGALRFWFRAVAAGHRVTDLRELWTDERQVFGSTDRPSPIRLRVDGQPSTSRTAKPDWAGGANQQGPHGSHYLLGQGLWKHERGLTRPYVPPSDKAQFGLCIRFSGNTVTDTRFLLALWAWLTYGGLGARTRRGFGQLACTAVDGDLADDPILTDLLTTRTRRRWEELSQSAIPASLRDPERTGWHDWAQDDPDPTEALPEFPTLAPSWWQATLAAGGRTLGAALDTIGQDWREFRVVTPPSSPEWQHAIHGQHDPRYPIAALGLPVGYHSQRSGFDGSVEPVRPSGRGVEVLRRASPVWLRPIRIGDGWQLFTHVFYARLLPADATLRITGDGHNRPLDVPDQHAIVTAWDAWLDRVDRLPPNFYGTP